MVDAQPKDVVLPCCSTGTSGKPPSPIKIHVSKGSEVPTHNLKSTIVACTGTPYIFLYGGFDENDALDSKVYLLNTDSMEWEVDDKVDGLYREGHSAAFINNGNILIFGGLPFDDEISNDTRNNRNYKEFRKDSLMMIYNIFDRKWIGPPEFALENAPSSRSRHACCLTPDRLKLYISGGLVKSSPLSDLYCYDLTMGTWSGPFKFVPRFDHKMIYYNDRIFLFGGLDGDMNHVKTITYYSLKNKTFGEVSISNCITSNLSSLYYDLHILESQIDPSSSIFLNLPTWNSDGGIDISRVSLLNFEVEVLFEQLKVSKFLSQEGEGEGEGEGERGGEKEKEKEKGKACHYTWICAVTNDKGKLYLLGNKKKQFTHLFGSLISGEQVGGNDTIVEEEPTEEEEETFEQTIRLSYVLEMDLEALGIHEVKQDSLSADFINLFNTGQFSDFQIEALATEQDRQHYENQTTYETKIIPVHKSILIARWPHFCRMISSGMNETINDKVLIPDPYPGVRAMLYYLYSGELEDNEHLSILDYSGLLILANLYELPKLKSLVLQKLYTLFNQFKLSNDISEHSISTLLQLWKDLNLANESILLAKVIGCIKEKWSVITRSKAFVHQLSKEDIVKLCQDSTDDYSICQGAGSAYRNLFLSQSSSLFANTEAKMSSSRNSLNSLDLTATPDTPARNTNSPFMVDSPAHHSLQLQAPTFPEELD
ncbi:hypothetical protein KGF56_001565 [Candida oxycetoniae]|uniref:BTB domain-containing protein n=1 Tax=Candida oxycetoniae TaxID=497107 RepID=A0AAI9SYX1_9ASCO|nr:uncharacterized protein KGF56_001565 [Candida oxycetoniae]KAI3405547.2 hypothetical protein KGF56_001565 [Candida oxycetoniae]